MKICMRMISTGFFVGVMCGAIASEAKVKFLIYGGARGWIGGKLVELLRQDPGCEVVVGKARIEDRQAVTHELEEENPDRVINAAGLTGRPNVDWCEDHQQETIRANVLGALTVADVCALKNIHVTHIGTGCIYEYDEAHPIGSGKGFTEEDTPNFKGSFYSFTKGMLDRLFYSYPGLLHLRVRMPISDDLHPRSFITKIATYQKVVNIPNSMTVLHDLLPIALDMALKECTGAYNLTNPGAISHNEILDLYKEHIDPEFTYTNFSLEEQAQVIKAGRSNNELDVSKLLALYPDIASAKDSIRAVFERMKAAEVKPLERKSTT